MILFFVKTQFAMGSSHYVAPVNTSLDRRVYLYITFSTVLIYIERDDRKVSLGLFKLTSRERFFFTDLWIIQLKMSEFLSNSKWDWKIFIYSFSEQTQQVFPEFSAGSNGKASDFFYLWFDVNFIIIWKKNCPISCLPCVCLAVFKTDRHQFITLSLLVCGMNFQNQSLLCNMPSQKPFFDRLCQRLSSYHPYLLVNYAEVFYWVVVCLPKNS